jgi:hypothetical protein
MPEDRRVYAPGDQKYDHHGHQLHDDQGFLAGLRNAFGVLPPEINGDKNRKTRRDEADLVGGERIGEMRILEQLADEPGQILPSRHTADGTGQDVVKHQRGNAEFRQSSAKGLLYRAVHATAHEHAAAFDVHRADRVGKHHDGENEPRGGFADVAFRFAACVVRRGGQIVQYDGGCPPEGDEGKEGGRGDNDARNTVASAACGSRGIGRATHVRVISISGLKCSHFSGAKSSGGETVAW